MDQDYHQGFLALGLFLLNRFFLEVLMVPHDVITGTSLKRFDLTNQISDIIVKCLMVWCM